MTSQVYFVSDNNGLIKIGVSRQLKTRLNSIASGRLATLDVLGTIEGDRRHEQVIHQHLAEHRVKGEWFRDCPEVRSFIDLALTPGKIVFNETPAPTPANPRIELLRKVVAWLVDEAHGRLRSKAKAFEDVAAAVETTPDKLRTFVNRYRNDDHIEFTRGLFLLELYAARSLKQDYSID